MEVKAGYKQTEVGVIPEDWVVKTVGEISDVKTGPFGSALHEKDYAREGTPIITVEHLGDYGVEHFNLPLVSDTDKNRLKAYLLRQGDIVFSRVGSVDRNALIKATEDGWLFSGRLLRVRPAREISSTYLSYHFHSEAFKQRVRDVAVGQTMASINTKILIGVKAIIPPTLAEQQAIAEALSDADALIEALEQLIAKKRQVKQGAMQELLTGKRRLPGFSKKWEEKTIGSLADVKTGPFGSALHERDYVSQGTPLITVEHLSENGLVHSNMSMVSDFDVQRLKAYTVQANDIVFSRVGVVDRNSLIRKDEEGWLFSGSLLRLRVIKDDIHAPFISYFFYSEPFRNYVLSMAVGQTRLSLNTKIISNTPITIPSLEEQIAIAEILSDMDAEIAALEGKLSKARKVKQGMMQELLTGRIRLL